MPSAHAAISPLLVATLTGAPVVEVEDKPTLSMLGSKLAIQVSKNKKMIPSDCAINSLKLKCKHCESTGKYDVGLIVVDLDNGIAMDEE